MQVEQAGIELGQLGKTQGGSRAKILMLTTFNLDEYVYHAMSRQGFRTPRSRPVSTSASS